MIIEIGKMAALCLFIAAVFKLIDWLMPDDNKRALGENIKRRLADKNRSFVLFAKTPVITFSNILTVSSTDPVIKIMEKNFLY